MRDLSELPDGWRMVRLGDVSEVNRSNWDLGDSESIRYLDLTAVTAPGRLSSPKEIAALDAPSRARRRVRSGDILVSTVRPNLRGFARVRCAADNLVASTGFAVVTPLEDVDGSLLFHHVMTHRFARYLANATTGQAYPAVRPSDVASYGLPLPPLSEQRGIAAVLDAIDEAIERTEAVISATERLRDALLHDLLTRGVPGWHTEWRTVPGLGSVPADWQVVRLKEILVLDQPGAWGDEPTLNDPGVCVLRAADLTRDGRVVPDGAALRRLSKRDRLRRLMRDGDLMLERSGGGPGTPVGRVALIDGLGPVYCNNFCQHTRVDTERCRPDYAVRALWHRYIQGVTARLEHQTTGIRNLDYAGYLAFPLPLPSLAEQDTIAKALDRADGVLIQKREERDSMSTLKASATDALLTGCLRLLTEG